MPLEKTMSGCQIVTGTSSPLLAPIPRPVFQTCEKNQREYHTWSMHTQQKPKEQVEGHVAILIGIQNRLWVGSNLKQAPGCLLLHFQGQISNLVLELTKKYGDETMKWLRKSMVGSFAKNPIQSLWGNICKAWKIRIGVETYPSSHCLWRPTIQKWKGPGKKQQLDAGDPGRRF
jgi:hypothetical protein